MTHTPLTEQQEIERGELLANVLGLKRMKDHKDRVDTAWGSKTMLGLYRTVKRIIDTGE